MIQRDLQTRLGQLAGQFPAIVLTGPRQSGKSTLCREVFRHLPYITLESPDVRSFAMEDPRGFLAGYPRGAVLDEIQNVPQLPSYLQEIIDRDPAPGRWILTGSHNLGVVQAAGQSLAGRVAVLHLLPLSRREVVRFGRHPRTLDETLLYGGYPRILDQQLRPADWLSSYVATYLERDVRTLTHVGDLVTFQRFVQLCAGRAGQLLNLSSLASDCGISPPTAKAWFSVLEASFIAFRLPSYHGNVSKRLIKMPKLHFYDSGLVCWLLGIRDVSQLNVHPLRGAIFESWVVSEIIKHRLAAGDSNGVYFFRDKSGLEADALVQQGTGFVVVEVKAGQTLSSDMAGDAGRVASVISAAGLTTKTVIVHGSDVKQTRNGVVYLPWTQIQSYPWCG
ncbi:MAG TPA: ATP-binding protein [Tepidisphaeraceae bacterium]|nr:ATP-binding protein [Tepidisphaeraceae bacterium]